MGNLCCPLLSIDKYRVKDLDPVEKVAIYSNFTHFDAHIFRLGVPFGLEAHSKDRCLSKFLRDLVQGDFTSFNLL